MHKQLMGLAAIVLLGGCSTVVARPDATDTLMQRYAGAVPGASLLVIKDGKPIVRRGYGMADMEHHVPATPATNYRLASVSKQFTAAAILLLAEDGKLKLDDPVRRWLPSLPEKYRRGHPAPFADPHRRAGRL
jgi:CubicO group peptidase (beta-lactamase class C family)